MIPPRYNLPRAETRLMDANNIDNYHDSYIFDNSTEDCFEHQKLTRRCLVEFLVFNSVCLKKSVASKVVEHSLDSGGKKKGSWYGRFEVILTVARRAPRALVVRFARERIYAGFFLRIIFE